MYLQFPNARLFIHDLISKDQLSGPEAILQASFEFGLVPLGTLIEVSHDDAEAVHCPCFATAKAILQKYFAEQKATADIATSWSSIERQAHRFEQALSENGHYKPSCCKKMAAPLFDLLLQEIRRHS